MIKYLPLSNLHRQHHKTPLIESEVVDLLFQELTVLEHLHSRDVTYWDLKSNNILVESRFSLRVQFIDFDLANDQLELKTFCGSKQYAAPEIFIGRRYIIAINIWSLRMIVLQYVYDFSMQHQNPRTNEEVAIRERESASKAQAVVFFNVHNDFSILSRDDLTKSLMIFSFVKQMNQCLMYLDEAHTRETNLNLPLDYRVAVTLGFDLIKDRLVQNMTRFHWVLFSLLI